MNPACFGFFVCPAHLALAAFDAISLRRSGLIEAARLRAISAAASFAITSTLHYFQCLRKKRLTWLLCLR